MTNKAKQTATVAPKVKRPDFVFKGFVRCDLVKDQRELFLEWSANQSGDDLFGVLCAVLDDGYKLSWGEGKAGMSASLANHDGPQDTRGFMLSAMASSAERALRVLLYKHLVVLTDGWPVDGEEGEEFFR